jgi:ribosomal protein S7
MSGVLSTLFSASKPPADHAHNHKTTISNELLESAQADIAAVLQRLRTERMA